MAKAKQTSITKKHITAVCKAIRTGCPISVAASTAGINRTTLYHWRNRGKAQPTGIHGELVAAMDKSRRRLHHRQPKEPSNPRQINLANLGVAIGKTAPRTIRKDHRPQGNGRPQKRGAGNPWRNGSALYRTTGGRRQMKYLRKIILCGY